MKTYETIGECLALHTEHVSLIYRCRISEPLEILYLGDRICSQETLRQLSEGPALPGYPSYGDGSSRSSAFRLLPADTAGLVSSRLVFSHVEHDDDTVILHLNDQALPLKVQLRIEVWYAYDIFGMSTRVSNGGDRGISLGSISAAWLSLPWKEAALSSLTGSWAHEMNLSEQQLNPGTHTIGERCGVRTTRYVNPSIFLSHGPEAAGESFGECVGLTYAWSGNWAYQLELDGRSSLSIAAGEHPDTAYRFLEAGESLSTPWLYLSHHCEGRGELSRRFHRWAKEQIIPGGEHHRKIVLNSWEAAYFDFDQDSLEQMIDSAADTGIELFVLDDGWFGSDYPRNSDTQGLGDWEVNTEKLPDSLDSIAAHCKDRGISFGLWIEPEMVNPKSRLYEEHPDWIIRAEALKPSIERHQLILDLSREDVYRWVRDTVLSCIEALEGLSYIKWDCNREIQEFSGSYAAIDGYVENYYRILDELRSSYPDLVLQDCASGGGRVEYGALSRTHEFWASDNTDPLQRIFIQWGTGMFFPPSVTAAHVCSAKNHVTGRAVPMKFRCDVAMSCRFGIEMSLTDASEDSRKIIAKAVSEYKRIRHIITEGELYRLHSPYGSHYASLVYILPDRSQALLFAWELRFAVGNSSEWVCIPALEPQGSYLVEEINPVPFDPHMMNMVVPIEHDQCVYTGEFLKKRGLEMAFRYEYDSRVYLLTSS